SLLSVRTIVGGAPVTPLTPSGTTQQTYQSTQFPSPTAFASHPRQQRTPAYRYQSTCFLQHAIPTASLMSRCSKTNTNAFACERDDNTRSHDIPDAEHRRRITDWTSIPCQLSVL